ncbi:MAG: DUF3108 domain-containing protein [Elusimicrobiota bacterium]
MTPYSTPFQAGESLLFAIRWGAITGGYSTLSVNPLDLTSSTVAYHIISEARSTGIVDTFYHVEDRNEAWLDAIRPRSLRYEKNLHEGKYRAHQIVELDQVQHSFIEQEERFDKQSFEHKQGAIPPDVLDILSSLYYVRTQPLAVGLSYTIDVHSGAKTWPLLVRVTKRERVKVKAGRFDCFRLEPLLREPGIFIPKGKKLMVWVTADDRHLPVLMRSEVFIGHVSAELVREQPVLPPNTDRVSQPLLSSGLN